MNRIVKTTVTATAALALMAPTAIGQGQSQQEHGKSTAPGQICKNESRKKTNHGKGKSPFAACVLANRRSVQEFDRNQAREERGQKTTTKSVSAMCRTESRKKDSNDTKSPYAACTTSVVKTRNALRAEEREREQEQAGS